VSFSSQSGALGLAILDYAKALGIGVRSFVSVGNKAELSSNDLLECGDGGRDVGDPSVLESFGNPQKFVNLARRISRKKPIAAVKSGRTAAGSRAASSHTGALAGADPRSKRPSARRASSERHHRRALRHAMLLANQPVRSRTPGDPHQRRRPGIMATTRARAAASS